MVFFPSLLTVLHFSLGRACRPTLRVPKQVVTPTEFIAVGLQVSSALAFLESRRVLHRDVAAHNVLVGANLATVKLGEIGAVRFLSACNGFLVPRSTTTYKNTETPHHPQCTKSTTVSRRTPRCLSSGWRPKRSLRPGTQARATFGPLACSCGRWRPLPWRRTEPSRAKSS